MTSSPVPTSSRSRLRRRRATALAAALLAFATPALAQYPDAWVAPRGALRIGFEPRYESYGERYDADGVMQPLGAFFSDTAVGARLFPTLRPVSAALAAITEDSNAVLDGGGLRTVLDADVRRFPLSMALGLSSRLTFTARVPFVTTRAQAFLEVDSTSTLGWNQAAPGAGNAAAVAEIQALVANLDAAAATIEGQIAGGGYDCPAGPVCAEAQALVGRARAVAGQVSALSGVTATGAASTLLPPFAPLAASPQGQALTTALQSLAADLQTFGGAAFAATLPLPTTAIGAADVQSVLTDSVYGYIASPIAFQSFNKRLGDVELGLRYGLVQRPGLRAVIATTVRLPTGQRDAPEHFTDLGTGDRQTDVEFGLETVWQPGRVAVAIDAGYVLQLSDQPVLRVAPYTNPIATAAAQTTLRRNLGDIIRLGIYPSLRMSEAFTAYASASYVSKSADRYDLPTGFDVPTEAGGPVTGADLALGTSWYTVSFGAGIYYRSARTQRAATLPVEAGIDYRSAFRGSGGLAPKMTSVNIFLRLYWRLFGGPPRPAPAAEPAPGS